MWPFDVFRSKRAPAKPEPEWWETVRRLEGDMRNLELEWERSYGKIRTALASLSRRQAREQTSEDGREPAPEPPRESPYSEALRRGLFG